MTVKAEFRELQFFNVDVFLEKNTKFMFRVNFVIHKRISGIVLIFSQI